MADKVVSGIGRELRYFEYKLRKKQQSSKKNKKDKNANPTTQELAWGDSTRSDDFAGTSEEFRKAVPGSHGEEQLQIQVALAMSREEEQERSRQSESDKMRLEMALKESIQENNSAKQQQKAAQPSLLDLSLKSAPAASSASADLFGSTATNDPWGGPAPPAATAPTFDPFAPQQQAVNNQPSSIPVATNNFATPNNAWGMTQSNVPAPVSSHDPWGATATQSFAPQPPQMNAFSTPQANDPWGNPAASVPSAFPPAQNGPWGNAAVPAPMPSALPTTQNGAWGSSDPFGTSQPPVQKAAAFDPFTGTASVPQPQSNVYGVPTTSAPITQSQAGNPFGVGDSTAFAAPPFDPLKDFDNLHIGIANGTNEPDPIVLQRDISSGKSVAKDIFPLNQVLEPVQLNNQKANGESAAPALTTKETELFLGENSNLVNLDSGWKTYQVPYCTKPLGTASHNPFQQTGPSKTLNEMMSTNKQPGF